MSLGPRGGDRRYRKAADTPGGANGAPWGPPDSLLRTHRDSPCPGRKVPPVRIGSGAPRAQIPEQRMQFFLSDSQFTGVTVVLHTRTRACVHAWVSAHRNTCRHVQEPSVTHNTHAHIRGRRHRHTDQPTGTKGLRFAHQPALTQPTGFQPLCLGTPFPSVFPDPDCSSSHLQLGQGPVGPTVLRLRSPQACHGGPARVQAPIAQMGTSRPREMPSESEQLQPVLQATRWG